MIARPTTSPKWRYVTAAAVAGVLLLAACGSDDGEQGAESTDVAGSSSPDTTPSDGTADDTTSESVVDRPAVESLPATPVAELTTTEIVAGDGPTSVEGDTVVVDYTGVRSVDGTEFDNSYDRGEPLAVGPLGSASVIAGWDQGLLGVQAGQTLQLDIPSELAYGDEPQGDIIQAGDDLTFVIEVRAVIPGTTPDQAPDVTVEPTSGTTEVMTTDLVEGTGDEAVTGSDVAVQYVAFNGADGAKVDSGWENNAPLVLTLGDNTFIAGFDEGITGMRVGGRRQVVIPAELAFGDEGNEELGIPAGADLIMVFDLLATY